MAKKVVSRKEKEDIMLDVIVDWFDDCVISLVKMGKKDAAISKLVEAGFTKAEINKFVKSMNLYLKRTETKEVQNVK